MPRHLLLSPVLGLAALFTGCQPAPAPSGAAAAPAAPATPDPARAVLAAGHWMTAAGVSCQPATQDSQQDNCTAGRDSAGRPYPVTLTGNCGQDGLFGQVMQAGGATLHQQIPAAPTTGDAGTLPDGQFVCLQASARNAASPAWYWVKALDPAQVPACAGASACPPSSPAADIAGWVAAEALDVFHNGLHPEQVDDATLADTGWDTIDSVASTDGRHLLVVLSPSGNAQAWRSVRLYAQQPDGQRALLARNDRLVPCAACGGLAGDPYAYSRFDDQGLDIVIGGGSRQRWSTHTRWQRADGSGPWTLAWVQREVVDTQDGRQQSQTLAGPDLGNPGLAGFDPATLPAAPILP